MTITYAMFHVIFTLPPLAFLLWRYLRAKRRTGSGVGSWAPSGRFSDWALVAHLIIAFVYTTPWDNYLVYRDVWGYPDGRVLFTIGYVPIEEYAFFLIQTAATGLFLYFLMRRFAVPNGPLPEASTRIRWAGSVVLLLIAAVSVAALTTQSGTYAGLILVWAAPVLALQWAFGGDMIVRSWRLVLTAVAIPTVYLWFADWVAIGNEIWWISESLTTGIKPFGLPIEEATFFLVTNLLVVFGLSMAHAPEAMARFRSIRTSPELLWLIPLTLWALSMVPTPLMPAETFYPLALISTGLLAFGLLIHAVLHYRTRAVLAFIAAVSLGWLVERIGESTGMPFGAYAYQVENVLLFGVPWLVPLGWFAFTYVGIHLFAGGRGKRALGAAVALVALDLSLDPLMVAQGVWAFEQGVYAGVPLSNFAGWFVSGLVIALAMQVILGPATVPVEAAAARTVFAVQAFLFGLGLALFGLPVAASVGTTAMLAVFVWAVLDARGRRVVAAPRG
jgi:putative membrane protein